jgi:hypothetical protein
LVAGALCFGVMGCNKAELQKKDAEIKVLTEQVATMNADIEKGKADLAAAQTEVAALKAAAEAKTAKKK